MERYNSSIFKGKRAFVGIDVHRKRWDVTILVEDETVFSGTIPGCFEALDHILERVRGASITAVYEAGYFGYSLHDKLQKDGIDCIVTPPSLIPQEYGNRVKNDRRDSRKLAHFAAKGLLRRVWVPTELERSHRQVLRRRQQLIEDRVRTQNRIKAELRFYGIELAEPHGKWSKSYVENLRRLRLSDRWSRESLDRLLEEYEFLNIQIERQTSLLRELSETVEYREEVRLLQTIPGVGMIAAMQLVLELQDVARFQKANQLAAYVGLTPSQYSSAEKIRLGRITKVGKNRLRGALVEVAWRLITKDSGMRQVYERLKVRAGAKRAIVGVARRTLLIMRRMLLDHQTYRGVAVA